MVYSQGNESSDDEDKRVADDVRDIITPFIQAENWEEALRLRENEESSIQQSFSHLPAKVDPNEPFLFAAQIQNISFVHAEKAVDRIYVLIKSLTGPRRNRISPRK